MEAKISASERPVRLPLVVLGASNVARGLPVLVGAARAVGADEILVAGGHGRSYGLSTTFLGRTLPPILESGIWGRIETMLREGAPPPRVVLTDIGNDLAYGVEPERLLKWVEICVSRLPVGSRATLALPPFQALSTIGHARFVVLRTVFFPTRRVSWSSLRRSLERVEEGLRSLAHTARLELVEQPGDWYGFDPIHHRRSCRVEAWCRMIGRSADSRAPLLSWGERARTWYARPASWKVFGLECGAPQPCRELDDGTRLWLY